MCFVLSGCAHIQYHFQVFIKLMSSVLWWWCELKWYQKRVSDAILIPFPLHSVDFVIMLGARLFLYLSRSLTRSLAIFLSLSIFPLFRLFGCCFHHTIPSQRLSLISMIIVEHACDLRSIFPFIIIFQKPSIFSVYIVRVDALAWYTTFMSILHCMCLSQNEFDWL